MIEVVDIFSCTADHETTEPDDADGIADLQRQAGADVDRPQV